MRKYNFRLMVVAIGLVILMLPVTILAGEKNINSNQTVFRTLFSLQLRIDKEHYYEEKFEGIPYVHNNQVYIFSGEEFGLGIKTLNGGISQLIYQPNSTQSDIQIKFMQKEIGMLLVIKNKTNKILYLDALMTIPEKENIFKTSILPIQPGLVGYESWPHPIVQLVLMNIRFNE